MLWILRRRYPSFERFAPTHGPLPKETYRQLMHAALHGGLEAGGGEEFLGIVREGYLVPMGLMRRRGQEYETSTRLDANELVRLLQPLIEHQPAPRTVYEHLAQPVYGLVPDQIHLLLIFLLIQGELDIVKVRRSYRDQFETLPLPLQYDRIVPASALGVDELRELERLCDGLRLRIPTQWTVLAQRRMARRLRETATERRRDLSSFLARLREHQGAEALTDQVSRLLGQWQILERDADELRALQQKHMKGLADAPLERAKAVVDWTHRYTSKLKSMQQDYTRPILMSCLNTMKFAKIQVDFYVPALSSHG